jgi:hypothetical protein
MAVATKTMLEICQEVGKSLGLLEIGTATGGSTTTLVSAVYPFKTSRSNASTKTYEGCELRIITGDEAESLCEIASYSPSTGTFTASIAWVTGPSNGDVFHIYKRGVRYGDIWAAINRALRKRFYLTILPVTLISDGDMEASGVTAWTNSDANLSKVATAGNLFRGSQSLFVDNTGANGYAQSCTLNVQPGTGYYSEVLVRAASGTAKFVVWDITNSAEIDSKQYTYAGKGRLQISFTTPGTCEQIAFRLQGVEADADTYWDNLICLRSGAHVVDLPDYITDESQVIGWYGNLPDTATEDSDIMPPYYHARLIPNQDSPLSKYKLSIYPSRGPVYILCRKYYSELSLDTSTTTIDFDWIVTAATYELLDVLRKRAPGQEAQQWKSLFQEYSRRVARADMHMYRDIAFVQGFSSAPNTPSWR